MMKVTKKNRLVNSPAYQKIMLQYNTILKDLGKVNNKKFYEQIVSKEIPNYSMQAWYEFLKRFKTDDGIIEATVSSEVPVAQDILPSEVTKGIILSNKEATSKGIALALNIASERLSQIMENPQLMTAKEAIDLLFKAMKAQDSRIHAIGRVREDNREEEKLSRAFSDEAYAE